MSEMRENDAAVMPGWARDLASRYFSRTQSTFILHGNTRDLVRCDLPENDEPSADGATYIPLADFLPSVLFRKRRYVISYDLSRGIHFADGKVRAAFERTLKVLDTAAGTSYSKGLPADPHGVIRLLHAFIRAKSAGSDPEDRRIAVIIDYAETVFPRADIASLSASDRAAEIALAELAGSREVIEGDVTLVLGARDLSSISTRIIESAYTSAIEVSLPDDEERGGFLEWYARSQPAPPSWEGDIVELRDASSGLTLVQLRNILAEMSVIESAGGAAEGQAGAGWREHLLLRKESLIERECGGMLEFVGSGATLDLVAVHEKAVAELRRDSELLKSGERAAVPSGYLICGPSGCGKSFLVRCFAGEAGVPCVELRNFREKWVGATEANLERLLGVLSALAPVVVIVDEADAALGDRAVGTGDSGLSGRVFSRLVSFMGDPSNRGRVVWFLITNRPDLLSIDLKRQGRAERHIPLFPPVSARDYEELFRVFVEKHNFPANSDILKDACDTGELRLSGSDFESVLFRAYKLSLLDGRSEITAADLKAALADFISPEYPDEIEYQTLLAVAESTSLSLLPEKKWRLSRDELRMRLAELRIRLPRG